MNNSTPGAWLDDEQVLRKALRPPALSPDAMQRIRRAAQGEWRRNTLAARRAPWLTAAASLLVCALGLAATRWGFGGREASGELIAHLARSEAPGLVELRRWRADRPLGVGSELRSGHTFEAHSTSLLSLNDGGDLRLAKAAVFTLESANVLRLVRGEIYVDIPPATRAATRIVVRTEAGEFRHIGTQFTLAIVEGATRLRVREGSVLWRNDARDFTVRAGTELLIQADGTSAGGAIAVSGQDWAWTETLTPDMDIENRPLSEFLEWVSRETGRKLVLADEDTRRQIAAVRLHGNVRGMSALQALTVVMASTTLHFELADGVIRIGFPR